MRTNSHWDDRYLALAAHIAQWSKDPSTKVGAVIVDELGRVVGHGYNGFPRGVEDSQERYDNREIKYKMVVHAELNAILNSVRDPRGCVLYCTFHPCSVCAGPIIQAGISVVYYPENDADDRWTENQMIAATMFEEAGVTCIKIYKAVENPDEEIPF